WQQRVELDQPTVLSVATDGSADASDGILSAWQTLPDSIRLVVTEGLVQMPVSFSARMKNGAAFAWVNLQRPGEFILPPAFYRQCSGERTSVGDSAPVGLPLGGAAVYVLGPDLQLVPHGVRGELYVGGDAVPRAVREDATWVAQRLVPDPFGAGGDAKLYRTRRAARYRPDGQIELL
ncbi:MAG: hypothetical protein JXA69_07895, partial [Phycisphaerae bacterium]|nr:hypothetical protein [Phycisphaerae bacterium]